MNAQKDATSDAAARCDSPNKASNTSAVAFKTLTSSAGMQARTFWNNEGCMHAEALVSQ